MGRSAKLRRARKAFKINRTPIPDYADLKSKFESTELRDWLIGQWNHLIDFDLFDAHHYKNKLATIMLEHLYQELANDYGSKDQRIEYNLNQQFFVSVGVNVFSWTVWAFIGDRVTGMEIVTSDEEEYRLVLVKTNC